MHNYTNNRAATNTTINNTHTSIRPKAAVTSDKRQCCMLTTQFNYDSIQCSHLQQHEITIQYHELQPAKCVAEISCGNLHSSGLRLVARTKERNLTCNLKAD